MLANSLKSDQTLFAGGMSRASVKELCACIARNAPNEGGTKAESRFLTGAFETMASLGEWEVIKKFREYSELKKIVLTIFLWSMQRQKKAGRLVRAARTGSHTTNHIVTRRGDFGLEAERSA